MANLAPASENPARTRARRPEDGKGDFILGGDDNEHLRWERWRQIIGTRSILTPRIGWIDTGNVSKWVEYSQHMRDSLRIRHWCRKSNFVHHWQTLPVQLELG